MQGGGTGTRLHGVQHHGSSSGNEEEGFIRLRVAKIWVEGIGVQGPRHEPSETLLLEPLGLRKESVVGEWEKT